ncbi:outer membrane protein [Candidatus Tisiphia endosymbiont of Ptychoptera albimana]|uniref:outer membrane protein n=1 Tax=Candidatus Tisiphia endosymbiont of Ptychoptera albimana TaxID=3066260 RepID=UPI001D619688|nr:outer membrane beta-barrel protein [Rickettsia endosymbiont of Sericostoma sp. HW-2014]
MKKLLLIAATSTTLLTSAASFAETGGFYLKAEGGATRLNMLKFKTEDGKGGDIKFKPIISGIFGIGAGYYIMDNVRAELTIDFLLPNPEFKSTVTTKVLDKDVSTELTNKEVVRSLLLNGYVDLYDAGIVKFFAGAGVGMAQVQQKITTTADKESNTMSFETANNFAYQLTAGASFNVADGINLDLTYSWRDYGEAGDAKKDKDKDKKDKEKAFKADIRGHNLMAGIRFDL